MRRVCEHFDRFDSIRLQWAMENEESSELEATLDLVTSQLVDLRNNTGSENSNNYTYGSITLSVVKAGIDLEAKAKTRLPRLVYHLYVSS